MVRKRSLAAAILALGALSQPVWAQDEDKPQDGKVPDAQLEPGTAIGQSPFTISGTLTATTDYVYRGLSLTRGGPAAQGNLTVRHDTGFFAGVNLSNVDMGAGGDIEVDGTVGYAQEKGNLSYGVGVNYYGYPSQLKGSQVSFLEVGSTLAYTIDKVKLGGQFYISPNASGPQGGLSYYVGAGASYSLTDAVLLSVGGGKSLFQYADSYWDYLASVAYSWAPVTLELKYTGTDPALQGIGGNRVTASLIYSF